MTQTLILHVGYPKTGTSSLQWFFHERREDLRRQGVYYPLTGQDSEHAHHNLAAALPEEGISPAQRARLFADLRAEIDQCGCSTVVLSSELLLGRLELIQASEEFRKLFDGRRLRVPIVLRSQETFLESLYRQFVLDPTIMFADTPEAFLRAYPMAGEYHAILSAWAAVVGKDTLEPIIYEQAVRGEGLIPRFCRLVGFDISQVAAADREVWRNVTHDNVLGIEIMRIANRCPDLTTNQRLEMGSWARLLAKNTSHLPLPKRLMSAEALDQMRAMLADSNRRLAEDYVKQPLDGFWFKVPDRAPAANA